MERTFQDAASAAEWMLQERKKRGWSTIVLADEIRAIARREGSQLKLSQQSISGFEQKGAKAPKRIPEWFKYARMAFEEGGQPAHQDVEARQELAYVRQVDISYAMGAGAPVHEYANVELIPFNLNFLKSVSAAPVDRLFLASGHGESMEPTLLRHDLILVDTLQREVRQQDQIWALEYAGGGAIKRLRRVMRDGEPRLLIISDNSTVPVEEASFEDVHIVGKVVWIGRRM